MDENYLILFGRINIGIYALHKVGKSQLTLNIPCKTSQNMQPNINIAELKKAETMTTDPAMARLMLEGPKELKCITVNGQIIVETEDDRERCQNTHFFHMWALVSPNHNCSQEKSREGSQEKIQVRHSPS